ncbi:hypothetical protein PLESTM_001460100 [Pleodorina starrii]|nr:hypothetical protein PLESTM_001460100 [Pleodorina starrii]
MSSWHQPSRTDIAHVASVNSRFAALPADGNLVYDAAHPAVYTFNEIQSPGLCPSPYAPLMKKGFTYLPPNASAIARDASLQGRTSTVALKFGGDITTNGTWGVSTAV